MITVGKKIYCFVNTNNTIAVDECGLKLHIPSDVISVDSQVKVLAQGLWGRNFEFPDGTKLISGLCSIVEMKEAVTVELIHYANIIDKGRQNK